MKTLVTGGAGFIGSNLVDALLDRGDEVVVIDNLSTGRHSNLEPAIERGVVLHTADVTDTRTINGIVSSEAPDLIFHLAAQIDVRRSVSETAFDSRVNVEGTINLLDAAHANKVQRFAFISTGGAIYGDSEQIPTPETAPIQPMAPYGHSKYCGEGYCHLYRRLHGLNTVCLRFGNVYGPRQDPLGEAGVIAIFCGKLQEGTTPQIVGECSQTRDYIYVGDVVSALIAASDSELNGSFNVGTEIETSVVEIAESLKRVSGGELDDPEFLDERPGEVQRSTLDTTKIRDAIGWSAQVPLDEGMRLTLTSLGVEVPSA